MRYKFKLEALRQYRNFQEEILQKELAQEQRNRDREIDLLEALIDKRIKSEKRLNSEQESIHGPHMSLYDNYFKRLSGEIMAQRAKVKNAETLCKEKMGALLEAIQNRKTIDKLREKDFHAYMESLNQNEQKFLNEIAINQFSRNNN